MLSKRNGCAIALLAGLIALAGSVHAQAPPAERSLTLSSGATLTVATDWTVTELKEGFTLEDPEKQLKVEVVEVDASAGLGAGISAAWSSRRPGFSRQELSSSDSPGREGWDLYHWVEYKTSPRSRSFCSPTVLSQPPSGAARRLRWCTPVCVLPVTSAKRIWAELRGLWTLRASSN